MFAKIKSRRGEALVEVLVATIVLIVGALAATRLFALATVNNQITKERVIATNLAREGLEAVRSIRDTNWLRFAGERRTCWNNLSSSACSDTADNDGVADDPIGHNEEYIATFDPLNYRWSLETSALNNRLNLFDGMNFDDEKYQLKIDSTSGLYNHSAGDDTVFYREIYTEYLNDDQTQNPLPSEKNNILRVTSTVQWIDRGKISEVTLTTILTDYLARKNHN